MLCHQCRVETTAYRMTPRGAECSLCIPRDQVDKGRGIRFKLKQLGSRFILDTITSFGWNIESAAIALGVSRAGLYKHLGRYCPQELDANRRRKNTLPITRYTEQQITDALTRNGYRKLQTANDLGVQRDAVYKFLKTRPWMRQGHLTTQENYPAAMQQTLESAKRHNWDLNAVAKEMSLTRDCVLDRLRRNFYSELAEARASGLLPPCKPHRKAA